MKQQKGGQASQGENESSFISVGLVQIAETTKLHQRKCPHMRITQAWRPPTPGASGVGGRPPFTE